jgi:hypothetical protein
VLWCACSSSRERDTHRRSGRLLFKDEVPIEESRCGLGKVRPSGGRAFRNLDVFDHITAPALSDIKDNRSQRSVVLSA